LDFKKINKIWSQGKNKKNTIGIATFSAHESKQWPLKNYEKIINKYDKFHFILFAFGEKEIAASKNQFLSFKNVELISKNLSLTEQMEIINKCKVFISLDSANMHLASLTSTPVVSIWGPTHPFLGFSPLFNDEYIVQLNKEELPCRPCSVYGKIRNKDIDCAKKSMINITTEMVLEKVDLALKN
jgi:ADP-heptose:LPS heptosyltransferase